jgi:hypothetical protein
VHSLADKVDPFHTKQSEIAKILVCALIRLETTREHIRDSSNLLPGVRSRRRLVLPLSDNPDHRSRSMNRRGSGIWMLNLTITGFPSRLYVQVVERRRLISLS